MKPGFFYLKYLHLTYLIGNFAFNPVFCAGVAYCVCIIIEYMKKIFRILLAAVLCVLMSSCGKIKDIHLTSYKIVSLTPVGFRGLDIVVDLGIDNPSMQFTVADINAELFRQGVSLGTFVNSEDIVVKKKTVGNYTLSGRASLSQGVSLIQALGYAAKFDASEYTISCSADVILKSGMKVRIDKKNVPLTSLIKE